MFAPGSDLVIRLRQVRQDGIEFDLAKVLLPGVEQAAGGHEQKVTVKMKVRGGLQAEAAGLLAEPDAPVHLDPQDGHTVIDFWHEAKVGLAANALPGLLVPPYDWVSKWRDGSAEITHLARNQFIRWGQTLAPGTEVVLDFGTRIVDGRADMASPESSLCVAYVEDGLLAGLPAKVSPAAVAKPKPPSLRASKKIQGNILAGFNKDHQVFLFLAFRNGEHAGNDERARAWLRELLDPPDGCGIATTAQVTAFNDQYSAARRRGDPGLGDLQAVWVNVAFTRKGIGRLQPLLEEERLEERFKAFWEGPAERAGILGDDADSAPQHWVFGGSGQPDIPDIHVLLTLGGDDVNQLKDEVNRQLARAVTYELEVVYQQRGDTLPGEARGHEHFGFKDGVSQPGVEGYTRPAADPHCDLDHPGTTIVPKDQFLCGRRPLRWMENGSFQVFRRLAQDVAGWRAQIAYLSEGFPLEFQMRPALLAAKLVGRWPSGTPIARAPMRDYRPAPSRDDNDFDYRGDDLGEKTPLFAHIRRLNNRRDEADQPRTPRILRRGIPYGAVFDPQAPGAEHEASAPRGLLFNAYMASIENQFERLQVEFANQPAREEPEAPEEPDPLVGVPRGDVSWRLRRVSGDPKKPVEQPLRLRRYVWTTGTVYAFAPSLDALRALAINDLDKLGVTASAPSQP